MKTIAKWLNKPLKVRTLFGEQPWLNRLCKISYYISYISIDVITDPRDFFFCNPITVQFLAYLSNVSVRGGFDPSSSTLISLSGPRTWVNTALSWQSHFNLNLSQRQKSKETERHIKPYRTEMLSIWFKLQVILYLPSYILYLRSQNCGAQ